MTTAWTADCVRKISTAPIPRIPNIVKAPAYHSLHRDLIYWDMWPIQTPAGEVASVRGRELWMVLTAPQRDDPLERHFDAKIRLLERCEGEWIDRGEVLPPMPVDYEREWSGSAYIDGEEIWLFFTAAGVADRPGGYQQRLFETKGSLDADGWPSGWSRPQPSVLGYGPHYMAADAHEGAAGKIKSFRDPAYFRDPKDGAEYLIFSGSLADATSGFNGAIGVAMKSGEDWELLPALIHADGVNNEMERAHVVFHKGRYYALWVTQTHTFAPEHRQAPTGLYGMVADSLFGEYRPLNGTGLVLANPVAEPAQCYSWFVSSDLIVSSFIDFTNLNGQPLQDGRPPRGAVFGGVPAPLIGLEFEGDKSVLISGECPA